MLGPWCQPLVVQFSHLLTTLTMAWDLVVKQLGGSIFLACNNEAHACVMQ